MPAVLAIDIGGSKIEAGVVDARGTIVSRHRTATPAGDTADAMWSAVVATAEAARAAGSRAGCGPIAAVGVGSAGPMTPGGRSVSPLNIPAWRDFPLHDQVASWSGLPTVVDGDGKALALGEGWRGAAVGHDDFMAMVVSTGVGGGLVLDGRLLHGRSGNAGHVGHVIVVPDGRRCACGAQGCLEAEASGLAIEAATGAPPAAAPPEVRIRTGTLVGRAVASVVALLDLPLVVVAGSVALGYGPTFFDAANAALAESTGLAFTRGARLVPAQLGADGPLLGAAALARTHGADPERGAGPG